MIESVRWDNKGGGGIIKEVKETGNEWKKRRNVFFVWWVGE